MASPEENYSKSIKIAGLRLSGILGESWEMPINRKEVAIKYASIRAYSCLKEIIIIIIIALKREIL